MYDRIRKLNHYISPKHSHNKCLYFASEYSHKSNLRIIYMCIRVCGCDTCVCIQCILYMCVLNSLSELKRLASIRLQ